MKNINEEKYPFFRFLIITSKSQKEEIFDLLKDLLKDSECEYYNDLLVIKYYDKERVSIEDILLSLSEDIGQKIKAFEGFCINTKNKEYLNYFLDIYNKYYLSNDYMFSTVSDLVFKIIKDDVAKGIIKKIVLSDLLEDDEFEKIVKGMFQNDLNVSKTASYIYMHRNTLNNKLDMIENYTTISLRKFRDAVALYELIK